MNAKNNKAKGLSLHIGVNKVDPAHYAGWAGPLNACEFDANDMQDVAKDCGFTTKVLLTSDAKRTAVLSAIQAYARKLSAGDMFLLTYSGHGGQVRDRNNDENDNEDETWCLYDGQLLDDELAEAWHAFPAGVRIFVISDSCHSGTVTRAAFDREAYVDRYASMQNEPQRKTKFMPVDVCGRTYRLNKSFYDKIQDNLKYKNKTPNATVRLISGCQDNQLSLDGAINGLFTGTLLNVWNSGAFQGDYAKFHKAIVRKMPPTQTPNHFVIGAKMPGYDRQKPFTVHAPIEEMVEDSGAVSDEAAATVS